MRTDSAALRQRAGGAKVVGKCSFAIENMDSFL